MSQGAVGLEDGDAEEQDDADEQQRGDDDVDQAAADARAQARRGKVERHRFAGDQVVIGQAGEWGSLGRHRRQHRLGWWTSTHTCSPTTRSGVDFDELTSRRRLDGAENDELVDLYQQVATHLSVVRTSAPDAALISYLSSLLARARLRTIGARTTTWRSVGAFFTDRFPAALYRLRWWWLATMAANVVVTAVMMWWLLQNPAVEQSMLSPDEVDQLVTHDFENYYSQYAASHFAAQVWINNAWVTALCIALGVLGAPVDLPALHQHGQRRDHRLDHDAQRPRRPLLGTADPARAARAHGGLRRRRRGPAAVLVVGGAGRRDTESSRWRGRAAPPGPSRSVSWWCSSSAGSSRRS